MTQNILYTSIKYVLKDLVGDVVYFPIWWYTQGLKNMLSYSWYLIKNGQEVLGLKIWIVNIFHPMFGQYDLLGRLISFFMRLVQIIFRAIFLFFWIIFVVGLFILWVVGPILVVYQILWQIV